MSNRLPRVRQAVLVAAERDLVVAELREQLELGEPFCDPEVGVFGLQNAVFCLGDTFLEVVSPIREGTTAGRLLERRGGDGGYMVMFQVTDLPAARARVAENEVREVLAFEFEDIAEVHLHPADMRGAIVSLSTPAPAESWRWGGPSWSARSAPLRVAGVTIAVAEAEHVADRWSSVIGAPVADAGVRFVTDADERGLVEVALQVAGSGHLERAALEIGGVRFTFSGGG